MKVYTKTGDKGQTSLVGGQRISKSCQRLETYGMVDELNSHVGVLVTFVDEKADKSFLVNVQNSLFVVGGYLATADTESAERVTGGLTERLVTDAEAEIDRLQEMLPPLKNFILPGGSRAAAYAHVCRTICRRTERQVARLMESGETVDDIVMAYINRLSDYFFVLARKLNTDAGVPDVNWEKTEAEE